jgi:hypothetical protein
VQASFQHRHLAAIDGVLITLGALAISVFIIVSALRDDVVAGWAPTVLPIYVLDGHQSGFRL